MAKNTAKNTKKNDKVEIAKIDSTIVNRYRELSESVHDAEMYFVVEIAGELNQGQTSVRVVAASIKEAQELGNAPTIRASHAQYFQTAAKILSEIHGAEEQKISDLLKLAARVQRERGVEGVDEALKAADSFAALDEQTPTQTQSKKENEKAEIKVPDSVEIIVAEMVARLGKIKNLKDAKTQDLQALKAAMAALHTIAKNTEKAA